MKKFLISILFLSLTTNIFSQNDDIKDVYYAFLQNRGKCNTIAAITYVLKEYSVKGSASYEYIKNLYPNIDSITIKNLKSAEKINLSFISCPNIKKILPEEEIKSNLKKLRKEYSKSSLQILELSSIGFNEKRNQAILTYFQEGESYLSTEGYIMILEKVDGAWNIVFMMNSIVY